VVVLWWCYSGAGHPLTPHTPWRQLVIGLTTIVSSPPRSSPFLAMPARRKQTPQQHVRPPEGKQLEHEPDTTWTRSDPRRLLFSLACLQFAIGNLNCWSQPCENVLRDMAARPACDPLAHRFLRPVQPGLHTPQYAKVSGVGRAAQSAQLATSGFDILVRHQTRCISAVRDARTDAFELSSLRSTDGFTAVSSLSALTHDEQARSERMPYS
jgi:hypothetical protein